MNKMQEAILLGNLPQPTIDLFYRHLLMEQKVIQVNETPQLAESILARFPNFCFLHVITSTGEVLG